MNVLRYKQLSAFQNIQESELFTFDEYWADIRDGVQIKGQKIRSYGAS